MTLGDDDEFGLETKTGQSGASLQLDDSTSQGFNSSGNASSSQETQPLTTPDNAKDSVDPKRRAKIRFRSPLEDLREDSPSPMFVPNGKKMHAPAVQVSLNLNRQFFINSLLFSQVKSRRKVRRLKVRIR